MVSVCNNKNQKCQKLIQKLGISGQLLINILEDRE
jgi:hypothetical protein